MSKHHYHDTDGMHIEYAPKYFKKTTPKGNPPFDLSNYKAHGSPCIHLGIKGECCCEKIRRVWCAIPQGRFCDYYESSNQKIGSKMLKINRQIETPETHRKSVSTISHSDIVTLYSYTYDETIEITINMSDLSPVAKLCLGKKQDDVITYKYETFKIIGFKHIDN